MEYTIIFECMLKLSIFLEVVIIYEQDSLTSRIIYALA